MSRPIEKDVGTLISSAAYHRQKALRAVGELPPFSPVLHKLLATLNDEEASFARISELIEKDTVLAGNILRLVNSAAYGRRGTISSVRHAVSLMGFVKLRNAALTLALSRMWSQARTPPSWSMVRFNLHSAAAAVMSDLLAQNVSTVYPEGAFVAGLLHDLGLLLVAIALPSAYESLVQMEREQAAALEAWERDVLGFTHSELSGAALADWNIPAPIQNAVRHYQEDQKCNGGTFPLSTVLKTADSVVSLRGIGLFPNGGATDEVVETTFGQLGLGWKTRVLLEEFEAEFEPVREFY